MADEPDDEQSDEDITKLIEGGGHGTWHTEDGKKFFTPHMHMFMKVPPHRLLSYFVEHGGGNVHLNLA
jgi:hypothetical protein